jgi:DNA mismatch repair protein MutS2
MGFFVSQKTLERLEWPQIVELLQKHARTPGGRDKFAWASAPELFESTRHGVAERLAETTEARSILVTGAMPPLVDVAAPTAALGRARKDAVLSARELMDVAVTCSSSRATRGFLESRLEAAPHLADLASLLVEHRDLETDIEASLERSGEVKDSASPALARARAQARSLASEIQTRIGKFLSDPAVAPHLSDAYFTVRNDRFVLPVRADARGSIRGIVHDASNTGQTIFIEPEALVEANNRHKRAEIEIEQETLRVLRRLSRRTASVADEVEANVATLEIIDAAFARAGFAEELDAVCPTVGTDGVVDTPQLTHPLLGPDAVPSDIRLGDDFQVLVVSGPNAGGKTIALKAVAVAALFVRAGLHIAANGPARVDLFDAVFSDIGDAQDIRDSLSTFSAHMANLSEISNRVTPRSLVVLDEIGVGTDPGEGAALAQAILESLAESGARVVVTTHYNLLKELAEVDSRFANASVEFDAETLEPTYVLEMGFPGMSSATAVAARMGISAAVIDRTNELLDREDRQLDRVLTELASSRAALDVEQREIAEIRVETEAARAEHQAKLQRLQERRDSLFQSMREELEASFRDAREQIAGVIRELQRKGTAQGAAESRQQLKTIEQHNRDSQREAGLEEPVAQAARPIHWATASAGDPVEIAGGGRGTLVSLPDRRGRVEVRLGSARVSVPMQRVGTPSGDTVSSRKRGKVQVTRAGPRGASLRPTEIDAGRCDLHGLRVDEAIDRLVEALDLALSSDQMSLTINHGVGSGALRRAVRDYLRKSPYIARYAAADPRRGGEGVTIAEFV